MRLGSCRVAPLLATKFTWPEPAVVIVARLDRLICELSVTLNCSQSLRALGAVIVLTPERLIVAPPEAVMFCWLLVPVTPP